MTRLTAAQVKGGIRKMKIGYDVFGKEYGCMLRNDPHDPKSIEHILMQNMVLLDEESETHFYGKEVNLYDMTKHDLYVFSKQFGANTNEDTLRNILKYTSDIADKYDIDISEMLFGGTEKEILERGTDWCFDMARATAALIDSLSMKARLLFLARPDKAYHGHVVLEVYESGSWRVCDPIYGYLFSSAAKDILKSGELDELGDYKKQYEQIAVCEFDPTETHECIVSKVNDYTLKVNTMEQNGNWLLGEAL